MVIKLGDETIGAIGASVAPGAKSMPLIGLAAFKQAKPILRNSNTIAVVQNGGPSSKK
jgi:hypothetical protein